MISALAIIFHLASALVPPPNFWTDELIDDKSAKQLAVIYATRVKQTAKEPIPFPKTSTSKNWSAKLDHEVWFCNYGVPELDTKDGFSQFICLGIGSRDGKFLGGTLSPAGIDEWKKKVIQGYKLLKPTKSRFKGKTL